MQTGFTHLDGRADDPWPPPRARGVARVVAVALLLFVLYGVGARGLVEVLPPPSQGEFVLFGVFIAASFAAFAGLFVLYAWVQDRRPLAALGLRFHIGEARRASPWFLLGVCCAAPLALYEAWQSGNPMFALACVAFTAPFAFVLASAEEVVFRGWMMQTLAARHGALIAIVATSVLFGIAHIEWDQTPLGIVVAAVMRIPIAVAFAIIALREGQLWGAVGMHAGWNASLLGPELAKAMSDREAFWPRVFADEPPMNLSDLVDLELWLGAASVALACVVVFMIAAPTWRAVLASSDAQARFDPRA